MQPGRNICVNQLGKRRDDPRRLPGAVQILAPRNEKKGGHDERCSRNRNIRNFSDQLR